LNMSERKSDNETFKDEDGKEYTVIRDPRYTIPLALPTGIYNRTYALQS